MTLFPKTISSVVLDVAVLYVLSLLVVFVLRELFQFPLLVTVNLTLLKKKLHIDNNLRKIIVKKLSYLYKVDFCKKGNFKMV